MQGSVEVIQLFALTLCCTFSVLAVMIMRQVLNCDLGDLQSYAELWEQSKKPGTYCKPHSCAANIYFLGVYASAESRRIC